MTIKSTEALITSLDIRPELHNLKKHLLTGTSHMILFIVADGVLLSLSVMLHGEGSQPTSGILKDIRDIGVAGGVQVKYW